MATMTHEEMEAVIDQGGSVIYEGVIYSTKESLPTDAELTEGDPAKEAAAAEALDKQIAALEAAKASIGKVKSTTRRPETHPVDTTKSAEAVKTVDVHKATDTHKGTK